MKQFDANKLYSLNNIQYTPIGIVFAAVNNNSSCFAITNMSGKFVDFISKDVIRFEPQCIMTEVKHIEKYQVVFSHECGPWCVSDAKYESIESFYRENIFWVNQTTKAKLLK